MFSSINFPTQFNVDPFRVWRSSCDSSNRINSYANNQISSNQLSQSRSTPNIKSADSFYWENPSLPEPFFLNVRTRLFRGENEEAILKGLVKDGRFTGLPAKYSRKDFFQLCSDFILQYQLASEDAEDLISFVHSIYDAPFRYWAIKLESHNGSFLKELRLYSSLEFWKKLCSPQPHVFKVRKSAERKVETWKDVILFLNDLINSPPPDRDFCKEELRRVRSAMGALTVLQRLAEGFLKPLENSNTNRFEEFLVFLNRSSEGKSFPNCLQHMENLHNRLKTCILHFPIDTLKKDYPGVLRSVLKLTLIFIHRIHIFLKNFSTDTLSQSTMLPLRSC